MAKTQEQDPEHFFFRDLHPLVRLGTASDRYSGWIGQIYSRGRWEKNIVRRNRAVAGKSFVEEVLPVESVGEYFAHFGVLEIDFTFYRPLVDRRGKPTKNLELLGIYKEHIGRDDLLVLKVPEVVFAPNVRAGGGFSENPDFLNPDFFTKNFYEPSVRALGASLAGFIFEQAYQRAKERATAEELAASLDAFFGAVPRDARYHVELRTEKHLAGPVFDVFETHGIGQVLSHWTWLPSLMEQFGKSGGRFLNSGGQCLVRLLTPRRMRYEDTYAKAFPFNALVPGMLDERMVEEAAALMWKAVEEGVRINVIVNNRAGGNAPLIARMLAQIFKSRIQP